MLLSASFSAFHFSDFNFQHFTVTGLSAPPLKSGQIPAGSKHSVSLCAIKIRNQDFFASRDKRIDGGAMREEGREKGKWGRHLQDVEWGFLIWEADERGKKAGLRTQLSRHTRGRLIWKNDRAGGGKWRLPRSSSAAATSRVPKTPINPQPPDHSHECTLTHRGVNERKRKSLSVLQLTVYSFQYNNPKWC